MIVITSNGLSSKQLLADVSMHTQGLSTAVIVPTASNPQHGDNDLPRLKTELERLHLSVSWFDFDKDDPHALFQYDVVEMSGGDPFYLYDSIRRADAEEILRHITHERMLIGVSAGAIVLQKDMRFIARLLAETERNPQCTQTGLGLVDHEFIPHYSQFCERYNNFEDRIRQYEDEMHRTVIRMNDGEGMLLQEESLR